VVAFIADRTTAFKRVLGVYEHLKISQALVFESLRRKGIRRLIHTHIREHHASRIYEVDWIVVDVRIAIEALRIENARTGTQGIHARKSSLLIRVVTALARENPQCVKSRSCEGFS